MRTDLDLKDKKILSCLDTNSRKSNSQIAKETGLSKDTVGYRIEQLEKKGIIKGYRASINMKKLGYMQYRILLKLININETKLQEFINFLDAENNVWIISIIDGSWDFAFSYYTKTDFEYYEFQEELLKRFRNIISKSMISQIIKYDEVEREYIANEKRKLKRSEFDTTIEKVDKIDLMILKILSNNARTSLIDIGQKLNLSSMAILQRIKNLEKKKIITAYKADIYVLGLSRDYYGVKLILNDYSEKQKLLSEIYQIPEMTAVLYTVGGYDIEFDLEVKDTKHYQKIMNVLRNKFKTIREVEYIRSIDYHKMTRFPNLK